MKHSNSFQERLRDQGIYNVHELYARLPVTPNPWPIKMKFSTTIHIYIRWQTLPQMAGIASQGAAPKIG